MVLSGTWKVKYCLKRGMWSRRNEKWHTDTSCRVDPASRTSAETRDVSGAKRLVKVVKATSPDGHTHTLYFCSDAVVKLKEVRSSSETRTQRLFLQGILRVLCILYSVWPHHRLHLNIGRSTKGSHTKLIERIWLLREWERGEGEPGAWSASSPSNYPSVQNLFRAARAEPDGTHTTRDLPNFLFIVRGFTRLGPKSGDTTDSSKRTSSWSLASSLHLNLSRWKRRAFWSHRDLSNKTSTGDNDKRLM